jgi:hypothetical protein
MAGKRSFDLTLRLLRYANQQRIQTSAAIYQGLNPHPKLLLADAGIRVFD